MAALNECKQVIGERSFDTFESAQLLLVSRSLCISLVSLLRKGED